MSVDLIDALAKVWTKIRSRHPDVPPVIILAKPADRGEMKVLGHFAALRWSPKGDGARTYSEVAVIAEHLDRKTEDIVETLLHEAAHAMNFARGIKDCSTTSQYHNKAFKTAAEELGLAVQQVANYGFARTELPEAAAQVYAAETDALAKVILHRRKALLLPAGPPGPSGPATPPPGDAAPRTRLLKATCRCPHIIRVSRKVLESTVIRCDSCGERFTSA